MWGSLKFLESIAVGRKGYRHLLAVVLLIGISVPAAASEDRIQELERQVEALRAALAEIQESAGAAALEERLAEIERQVEIVAAEIERMKIGEAAAQADRIERGMGPAASKIYRTAEGLSIGGYGEMLYETFSSERDDGTRAGEDDELDFLRAIFYFGYKFNDRWLFNSEIEYEHASTGKEGEVSVEFAYLDYLWRPELNVRTGMVLLPMGFVNELHEPTVFLGARRPDVESRIIPSTWRENGVGIFGEVGPFSYRSYVVNGLRGAGFSSSGLRGGRQKGSKALAEDFAWVGRLDYTAVPGFLAGVSAYVGDSGQDLEDAFGRIDVGTSILEGHLEWKQSGWWLRALMARAELDDVSRLNQALGLTGSASVGEELEGFYLELAYDLLARRGGEASLLPYVRLETLDTQAEVPAGFARNPARDVESLTLGLAYQPIDRLIFKIDHQDYDNEAGNAIDQVNLAVGYVF